MMREHAVVGALRSRVGCDEVHASLPGTWRSTSYGPTASSGVTFVEQQDRKVHRGDRNPRSCSQIAVAD